MSRKTLFLLTIFFTGISFAQTNTDSLFAVWSDESKPDSARLKAIDDMAFYGNLFTNPDSAFALADLEFEFAKAAKDTGYMASSYNTKGSSFLMKGEPLKSTAYFDTCVNLYKKVNDRAGVASTLNNLGIVYHNVGNLKDAVICYTEAIQFYDQDENLRNRARTLLNLGNVYAELNDYDAAMLRYGECKSLQLQLGDEKEIVITYLNSANVIMLKGELEAARIAYDSTVYLAKLQFDTTTLVQAYANIAGLDRENKAYETSALHCEIALQLIHAVDNARTKSMAYTSAAETYWELKQVSKSLKYGELAFKYAEESNDQVELREASEILYTIYRTSGKYADAIRMNEIHLAASDSINSSSNRHELIRQEYKYAYEKQAIADSLVSLKEKLQSESTIALRDAKIEDDARFRKILYAGLAMLVLLGAFILNRLRVTRRQKVQIELQKDLVDEKNKEILDSISYAKRIQNAILPPAKAWKSNLSDSFVLYMPKDIVAGDFYWMEKIGDTTFYAAADCTGHGVPGAMVSVICNNGLNRSVREFGLTDPGEILNKTRELVIQEFEKSEEEVKDGMDIALCALSGNSLKFAGANNPLWILRDSEFIETKGDKMPIGKYAALKPFTTNRLELVKGDIIYTFSDGFIDQFGGEKGKKLKSKNFKQMLIESANQNMDEQKNALENGILDWMGSIEQVDDICIIGVRV